jgi:hypothetical protein
MKRSITIVTLLVLVVVSYGLYNLKYEVEDLRDHADGLRARMDEDRRAIKVLQAEWAYLTRPDRLQRLSNRFTELQPTVAKQVGEVADLRLKPVEGLDPVAPVIDTGEGPVPKAAEQAAQAPTQEVVR